MSERSWIDKLFDVFDWLPPLFALPVLLTGLVVGGFVCMVFLPIRFWPKSSGRFK